MTEQLFLQQLSRAPEGLKQELLAYFEYLMFKFKHQAQPPAARADAEKTPRPAPQAGFLKGSFRMADDFDEPLDDFKEHMP